MTPEIINQLVWFIITMIILALTLMYFFLILKPLWNEKSLKREEEKRMEDANRSFNETLRKGGFQDYYESTDN